MYTHRFPLSRTGPALALMILVAAAQAQTPNFTFFGKLLDPSRAPIEGATVFAIPEGRHSGPSVISGQDGTFSIPLTAGTYTLRIAKQGFLEIDQAISVPQAEPQEFVLRISPVRNTVTVTENAGYQVTATTSATKTPTLLRDLPQSITVVPKELIQDQMMMSIADVVRYIPGVTAHQGENNRDQLIIRGNSSSADSRAALRQADVQDAI